MGAVAVDRPPSHRRPRARAALVERRLVGFAGLDLATREFHSPASTAVGRRWVMRYRPCCSITASHYANVRYEVVQCFSLRDCQPSPTHDSFESWIAVPSPIVVASAGIGKNLSPGCQFTLFIRLVRFRPPCLVSKRFSSARARGQPTRSPARPLWQRWDTRLPRAKLLPAVGLALG